MRTLLEAKPSGLRSCRRIISSNSLPTFGPSSLVASDVASVPTCTISGGSSFTSAVNRGVSSSLSSATVSKPSIFKMSWIASALLIAPSESMIEGERISASCPLSKRTRNSFFSGSTSSFGSVVSSGSFRPFSSR